MKRMFLQILCLTFIVATLVSCSHELSPFLNEEPAEVLPQTAHTVFGAQEASELESQKSPDETNEKKPEYTVPHPQEQKIANNMQDIPEDFEQAMQMLDWEIIYNLEESHVLSLEEAAGLIYYNFGPWNRVFHRPNLDKQAGEVRIHGFVVYYPLLGELASYAYAWVNSATWDINFEESGYSAEYGRNLYGNIPDNMFPIPMRDGAVIPYDRFVIPGFRFGLHYIFEDVSVMEIYMAQLRAAGFVYLGANPSVESLWRYEREKDGAFLDVEMFSGEQFILVMNFYIL